MEYGSMITIKLNDIPIVVRDGCTLGEALVMQGYAAGSYAVALNENFVSRKDYQEKILNNHDHLVIIHPMQGG
jgi:thiamine biosynthesis protein ThiS